jgi:hypothetical protein
VLSSRLWSSGVTLDSLLVVIQAVDDEVVHFAGRNCGLRDFRKFGLRTGMKLEYGVNGWLEARGFLGME